MTTDDVLDVLKGVRRLWQHSDIDGGDPKGNAQLWLAALAGYDRSEVDDALTRLYSSGREHAPTVGVVVNVIERERQGEAPSYDDLIAEIWRALPYGVFLRAVYKPTGQYSPCETAEAVALMQAGGAHEAALRFVQDRGLRFLVTVPDGEVEPLDMNQQADRRDATRHYRDMVVRDWRENPRRGLALARVCRRAELDASDLLAEQIERRRQLMPVARPALPAPADSAADEGPFEEFDLATAWEMYRRDRADARVAELNRRAAARQAEVTEHQAAVAELVEHASTRDRSSH